MTVSACIGCLCVYVCVKKEGITVSSKNVDISVKKKAALSFVSLNALITIWCEVPLGQKGTIYGVKMGTLQ